MNAPKIILLFFYTLFTTTNALADAALVVITYDRIIIVSDTKSVVVDTSGESKNSVVKSWLHELKDSYFTISRRISFNSGFSPEKLLRKHLRRSKRGTIFDPRAFLEKCQARLKLDLDVKAYKGKMKDFCEDKIILQATIIGQENKIPYVMSLAIFLSGTSDEIEFKVSKSIKKVSDFSQFGPGIAAHFAIGETGKIFRYFSKHRIKPDIDEFHDQALEAFKLQSAATPDKVSFPLQMVEYRVGEEKGRWLLKPKRGKRPAEVEEKPVEKSKGTM